MSQPLADYITEWIAARLGESGLTGLVIGVSGGVDSALASTLCARTGQPVRAFSLPIHQRNDEVSRAEHHLAWLAEKHANVTTDCLDLTDAFEAVKAALVSQRPGDLALANTRSRLRMAALYAVAGQHRMLVCGTGNKVEDFGVGFFTKYGDGGVDISPIADLNKTEVRTLAAHLDVATDIVTAAPTDGLWADGRSDEEQIGASYAELEWAMDFDGDAAALRGKQAEVLRRYTELHRANLHKMRPIPVCTIPSHLRPEAA